MKGAAAGSDPETPPPFWRQAGAEVLGTFFLTLGGAGVEVAATLFPDRIDRTVKAAVPAGRRRGDDLLPRRHLRRLT
jgi:hypothetical protein